MVTPSGHGDVAGVVLAGGLARRMGGGDKGMRVLGGETMLARVIARAAPQVRALALNANGDPFRFRPFGLPVLPDVLDGNVGPLAGILTGLRWMAAAHADCRWLASFASDAPFFPLDLVARLRDAAERSGAPLACARSGGRAHPVFGLWHASVADDLDRALAVERVFKIDRFTARHALVHVDFDDAPVDPFFNVNTLDDLAGAEALLARVRD